jgi:exopolysaccharide production protein ExoQ
MPRLLLVLIYYAAGWSASDRVPIARVALLGLLAITAFYLILRDQVKIRALSAAELAFYSCGLLSVAVAMIRSDPDSSYFSLTFLAVAGCTSFICRAISLDALLSAAAEAALLIVATILIVDHHELSKALSISIDRREGLFRFQPLGMHPDLGGFVLGGFVVLLIRYLLVAPGMLRRIATGIAIPISIVVMLATSARAGLVALLISALICIAFELRLSRRTVSRLVLIVVPLGLIAGFVEGHSIANYLYQLLEVGSKQRGLGSGGTGRVEIWRFGIATVFSNPALLAFGNGLRNDLNFSTESSYIQILFDSGLFVGALVIGTFIAAPLKALWLSRTSPASNRPTFLVCTLFVFLLVQSIFNRYLLAIGNPMSLIALMLVVSLSLFPREFEAFESAKISNAG